MKYTLTAMLLLALLSCRSAGDLAWNEKPAPETFTARFETTKGTFDIQAQREWSPAGVDRLYHLIQSDFYTDIAIFRVVPGYVVQFGIHNDSTENAAWMKPRIVDEPVIKQNTKGTIAFARGGPQTRTTQLFINLENNSPRLDTLSYMGVSGFPVIAEVISGMDTVTSFYSGYGNKPSSKQDSIYSKGNAYLKRAFPKIDYINQAYILEEDN